MTNKLLILLTGTALALAACGKHDTANTAAGMDNTADMNATDNTAMSDNVAAPAASPLTAQGFANAAAASDHFEIESSKLAATQASSAKVKDFAKTMISAHTISERTPSTFASFAARP